MKNLNHLKGSLRIKNLGDDLQAKSDFEAASLKEKSGLRTLVFDWNNYVAGTTANEAIYKYISNIRLLKIISYRGPQLWMMDSMASWLSNITSIHLDCCIYCKQLPPLEHIPRLKSIFFRNLEELEYIDERKRVNVESINDAFFPSLQFLTIRDLPKLKGWWRETETETGTVKQHLPSFPNLSSLDIVKCPKLKSMPSGLSLTYLSLCDVSSEVLQQQLIENMGMLSSSSSSSLEDLHISCVKDLEQLPDLSGFTSLRKLLISGCTEIEEKQAPFGYYEEIQP